MKFLGLTVERAIGPDTNIRFADEMPLDRNRSQQVVDAQRVIAEIACDKNIAVNLAPAERYHFFDDATAFRDATRRLTGNPPSSSRVVGITSHGHSLILERGVAREPSRLVHEAVHNIASRTGYLEDERRIRRRAPGLNELGTQEITNNAMYLLGGFSALDYPSAYDELLVIGNHFLPKLRQPDHPIGFVRNTFERDILQGRTNTLELAKRVLGNASLQLWQAFDPHSATLADSIQLARDLELPGAVSRLEDPAWTGLSGFTALLERMPC